MTDTVHLSDESIEKLAEALRVKLVPLTPPHYVYPTYRPPYPYYWPYPYVTSATGTVPGWSYVMRNDNG